MNDPSLGRQVHELHSSIRCDFRSECQNLQIVSEALQIVYDVVVVGFVARGNLCVVCVRHDSPVMGANGEVGAVFGCAVED